jgi:hypothetical protein
VGTVRKKACLPRQKRAGNKGEGLGLVVIDLDYGRGREVNTSYIVRNATVQFRQCLQALFDLVCRDPVYQAFDHYR